jgi:hypothetical protein
MASCLSTTVLILAKSTITFNPIKGYSEISKWTATIIGKKVLLRTFGNQLSRFLNKNGYPVKLKIIRDHTMEMDDWTIGAEYDPELDEAGQKPFRINFIINHHRVLPWLITEKDANELSLTLVETLVHEYQHLKQYRERNFNDHGHTYNGPKAKIDDAIELNYLSNPDEIDAYSSNIATRLYIEEHLLNITRDKEHWDLHTYYKAFGKKHPVTKELETQIAIKLTIIREKEHGKD